LTALARNPVAGNPAPARRAVPLRIGIERSGRNNFDALRLMAALLVVYGHEGIDGTGTGGLRLLMFFSISGYLIAGSWNADPHVRRFMARRFLRLWPAYACCIVVCAGLSAIFPARDMPELSRHVSAFYLSNLWFAGFDWGYFPFSDPVMNKSLWMIGFEVDLYFAFALVAGLNRRLLPLAAGLVFLVALVGTGWDAQVRGGLFEDWSLRFAGYFAFGVLLRELPLLRGSTWLAAFVLLGLALIASGKRDAGLLLLIPAAAVWFGEQSWPVLRSAARFGDLSLGVFLWGWPVHQVTSLWLAADVSGLVRFEVVSLLALLLAWVSWRCIEAPAQRLKPARPAPLPAIRENAGNVPTFLNAAR
jgi:peptidoglycan/LPS O-acetylase OafA/YrhL